MNNFTVMMRLLKLVKPLTFYIFVAVVTGVLGFLCASFITVFAGFGLLSIMGLNNFTLQSIFIIISIFAVSRGILHYIEQACNHYIAFRILALIRDKVFEAIRRLSPAKLDNENKGNLVALVTSDIELLEVFYAHTISPLIISLITTTIMVCFIGYYHITLGIISLLAYIIVGIIIPITASKMTKKVGLLYRNDFGNMNSYFLDSLRGIQEVIQFNNGEQRINGINNQSDKMESSFYHLKRISGVTVAFTGSIILAFTIILLLFSSTLYINNQINFDAVVITTLILLTSFGSVISLANLGSGLSTTLASGNRVLNLLDEQPIVKEVNNGEDIKFTSANINKINFSYDKEIILKELSLNIIPNKINGIIGKSGSGKSTILKLLMRFRDVDSGSVVISSKNIQNINTKSLRNSQSFVTQHTQIFHDTIENNIKIANISATYEQVVSAAKKASLHEFIIQLPNSYKTIIGELGDNLSGGERQRIGIARAFLHDAPLLLLDEPTSNLDSLNEAVILKSLKQDTNRTIVIVSHRLSTLNIADNLYICESSRKS